MNDQPKTIYEYVKSEETAMLQPISLVDGGEWNFQRHVQLSTLFKNSMYSDGTGSITTINTSDRPFKNILTPILNLQYRAEGFDVKDIVLYVDDPEQYWLSLIIRKYHERWALDNDVDTFLDDLVECYVDYGGALVKDVNDVKPEVVPLQSIAFCDQTSLLSGPIGIRHFYSPDELLDMAKQGWGKPANGATATLEEVIEYASSSKSVDMPTSTKKNRTTGKTIELIEVQGVLPMRYLPGTTDDTKYTRQTQIICFYTDSAGKQQGLTLFAKKRKDNPFRVILRDKIYGRCLGRGGIEELFQDQIWTNYSEIRKKELLDAAAKIVILTSDPTLARRNSLKEVDNLDILEESMDAKGTTRQLDTEPKSLAFFEQLTNDWEAHAREVGSATGALLGDLTGGQRMSFQAVSLLTSQGQAIHDYRKGKIATFVGQLYREWTIPQLTKEAAQGATFLTDLTLDELKEVAEAVADNQTNTAARQAMLAGKLVTPADIDAFKQQAIAMVMKKGGTRFMEIVKGEFEKAPLSVKVDVANKQKDLTAQANKLTGMVQMIMAAFTNPGMAKVVNQILQAMGFDPIDFTAQPQPTPQPGQQPPGQGQPQPQPNAQQAPQLALTGGQPMPA